MNKKAIVLFSGGLDSTTCLVYALEQGFSCYALSFVYGQKHHVEVEQAGKIAGQYGVKEHKILSLPLDEIRGSSLTDKNLAVRDYQASDKIPDTYVPARNTIFLSFALGWGEVLGAYDIFLGANHLDYSGYPDCRPEYLHAFEKLATLATKTGVEQDQRFKIHTPLLSLSKAEIIRKGLHLGIDYSQTISCYRADINGRACGSCDSCVYRKKGFTEAGVTDPTIYA
ncbi:7-cyano-7-deazaguanine synthase [Aquicella siphonis]|uniref:7-cyano-7-deazaguanine synthase n=1 Tax=Aquicella siphonis TaxID=254247 RepID=A0A5E4PIS6_9COXI|nr:7-cyano-7-deazaguanine synthase QueC [Aquicella siphonis]VVC76969.1 7-cyano-7-deazaguanine synthase [Aquicella siphonis]